MAQAADTRAASLFPFFAISASASIAPCTSPSSSIDSAARMAAVSELVEPAGRPAPVLAPPLGILKSSRLLINRPSGTI
jgi:hypothetical protein